MSATLMRDCADSLSSRESPNRGSADGFVVAVMGICLLLASCEQAETISYRNIVKDTFPVTGRILVDGEPVERLLVTCQSINNPEKSSVRSMGLTDAEGNVSFSTYEASDGVPAGEYVLTFTWQDWDDYWSRFDGPDKFDGKYAVPETSEYRLTVKEGEPADLGTIELSTQEP